MNLAESFIGHPADSPALNSRGRDIAYGELLDAAARIRRGLTDAGIAEGDRVAIVAANNWYFVVSYLAVLGGGGIAVPLNPASPAPELTAELAAVGAAGVVVGPTGRKAMQRIDRADVPDLRLVVCADADSVDGMEGAVAIDDLLAAEPMDIVPRDDDDLAVLMFTSGTAGSPKAAMLSHGNLRSNLDQILANPNRNQMSGTVLGVLPFFHIFGLNVVLNLTLTTGGRLIAVERFDPESALETVKKYGVTVIAGVPTMWSAWAHLPGAPADAFATVDLAGSGASRLDPAVHAAMLERFGVTISEGYGLTEVCSSVTTSVGLPVPPGSIGAPSPGVRMRLVDADGSDVLVGDVGEIQIQGPNVFKGYWNDAEATAAAFTDDGWLRTGDLAVVDDDGFLYIVDRMKDLIIVSGFNVYPAEVEEVVAQHPGVAAVAVVGVQHPHSGEAVKAYVVVVEGASVEEDDIISFCEQRLARYKCPQKVLFVDELPKNPTGKVLKRQLG